MSGLNPIIEKALIEIDFVKRYESISKEYSLERRDSQYSEELKTDKKEVIKLLNEFGYDAKYYSSEKYYKIDYGIIEEFTFGVHMLLPHGKMELVWIVEKEDELLLGEPWIEYSRELIDIDYIIKAPFFGSYDDLKHILEYTFQMYEDFKEAVVSIVHRTNVENRS